MKDCVLYKTNGDSIEFAVSGWEKSVKFTTEELETLCSVWQKMKGASMFSDVSAVYVKEGKPHFLTSIGGERIVK